MGDEHLPKYLVRRTATRPGLNGKWDSPVWRRAETLDVAHFHPKSSRHHPATQARLLYDAKHLYGMFRVKDRYVTCTHTGYQTHVYKDSCVEFFVQPKPGKGYMNFEMNCGGGLLLYYIADCTRKRNPADPDDEFNDFTRAPADIGSQVRIYHSLPYIVYPEITDPVEWFLEFHIPIAVLETYVGPLGDPRGQQWRANFNKCADESSHPHWAAWASIGEELNLHQPDKFGVLRFDECPEPTIR
jgi:hypothetical protein